MLQKSKIQNKNTQQKTIYKYKTKYKIQNKNTIYKYNDDGVKGEGKRMVKVVFARAIVILHRHQSSNKYSSPNIGNTFQLTHTERGVHQTTIL